MDVTATTQAPGPSNPDTVVVGVLDGEGASADAPAQVAALLSTGEARSSFKSLALPHVEQQRWLLAGLGSRDELTAERARAAAAVARDRARELSTTPLCWPVPRGAGGD